MTPKNSAKLVRIAAWMFISFAIIWGLAPYQAVNAPARLLLDLLDLPFGDAAPTLNQSEMWLSSIGAGLVIAISIMLLGIVAPALEKSDKVVVRVTIWAFISWYLVDSVGSIASGVASNALFNSIFLAIILLPLLTVKYELPE